MSKENVEIVRAWFEAWNATGELDLSLFHPELVYHPRADEPDPSPHIGRDAYERLLRGFLESFSEITFEILEVIDAGDHVVASTVLHARGSASGADVNDAYVFVNEFRDGLVVEGWEYRTKQEALEALGLPAQVMSQDNIAFVTRMYEAWNRSGGVPQLELMDPSIEVNLPGPGGGTYRGHAGLSKALDSFWDFFEDHRIELEDCIAAGEDVVATVHYYGRGKASGAEVDMRHWHVWTFRERKIVRWRVFNTMEESLEAVGEPLKGDGPPSLTRRR